MKEVVGAVIVKDGKILAAQRPEDKSLGGYWEFPGGKVEENEDFKVALRRELEEEMSCKIEVHDYIIRSVYNYDFGDIALTTFICTLKENEPILNEHQAIKWLSIEELDSVEWAPADEEALRILKRKTVEELLSYEHRD